MHPIKLVLVVQVHERRHPSASNAERRVSFAPAPDEIASVPFVAEREEAEQVPKHSSHAVLFGNYIFNSLGR